MQGFFYACPNNLTQFLLLMHKIYDFMHRQPSQLSVKSRCFLVVLSLS